jgi:hypothetical protein
MGQDGDGDRQSWYCRNGSLGSHGSMDRTPPSGSSGAGEVLGDGLGAVPESQRE